MPRDPQFALRVGVFFGALFSIYGAQVPFLPLWLHWRGLTAAEIGTIAAAPLLVRLVATPGIAFFADRSRQHRRVVVVLAWGGLLALLTLSQLHAFWPMLVVSTLSGLWLSTVMPLTETVAMAGVRREGHDYGRMRLWGSFTFIAASFFGGLAVDYWGAAAGIWVIVCGALLTVAAAHALPRPASDGRPATGSRLRLADVATLFRCGPMIAFLIAAAGVQASHAVMYTFGALHWRSQGISSTSIGLLWAVGVAAEIVIFFQSKALVARLGPVMLLLIGSAAGIVRWLAMAFDPPLATQFLLQVLHGVSFGAAHIGAIHFIARAVPERQAGTAQALYATLTSGIGMSGAMLIAGQLYGGWGGRTYLLMVPLAGAGFLAALALRRLWDGQEMRLGLLPTRPG